MGMYLEHANINVSDLEKTIDFLQTAIPDLKVRGQGGVDMKWAHVGDDYAYVAINERSPAAAARPRLNHIGLGVEGVRAVRERLLDAGYQETYDPEWHEYRSRVYISDTDGLQWEFVEYHTDDPEKRNFYD